jgi:hypothetical protein
LLGVQYRLSIPTKEFSMKKFALIVLVVATALLASCSELPTSYTVSGDNIGGTLEFSYNTAQVSTEVVFTGTVMGPPNEQFHVWVEAIGEAGEPQYRALGGLTYFGTDGKAQFEGSALITRPASKTVKVWLTKGPESPNYANAVHEEVIAKPQSERR